MNLNSSKPQRWLRRLRTTRIRKPLFISASALATIGLFAATLHFSQYGQPLALGFQQPQVTALPVIPKNMQWGFAIDEFSHSEEQLRSGDILGNILIQQGLTYPQVARLVENCKDKFNITSLRIGKKLHFLAPNQGQKPQFMVYEPSPYEYAVFQLREPYSVEVVKREVKTEVIAASGILETSFWQALTDNGLSDELADGMIDVLSSSVDFYHQKKGDRFKVVFEQHFVEGKPVGTGNILAAIYEREGKDYYAFRYEKPGDRPDYFDFEGRPARQAFLKAPVKFSRISSRYNLHRFHPVLRYTRAHLGTDYAAPHGTPIMAVAKGTVVEATRRGGNGNFVKIRHDATYQTQYLHMSGFAKGIRPGTSVAQGQTIGYVGSTGLATGPHVCFRFWKNGREVDHTRLHLPQPDPMKGADFQQYVPVRDQLVQLLNSVRYRTREEILAANAAGSSDAEKLMKVEP